MLVMYSDVVVVGINDVVGILSMLLEISMLLDANDA